MSPSQARRFSKPVLAAINDEHMIGVRAGLAEHRFLGIWAVVANGRVFVRSWNDKPTGWYRAFLAARTGAVQVPWRGREIPVRAKRVASERTLATVDAAYAAKYVTPASRKWVRGFARGQRRLKTLELVPR